MCSFLLCKGRLCGVSLTQLFSTKLLWGIYSWLPPVKIYQKDQIVFLKSETGPKIWKTTKWKYPFLRIFPIFWQVFAIYFGKFETAPKIQLFFQPMDLSYCFRDIPQQIKKQTKVLHARTQDGHICCRRTKFAKFAKRRCVRAHARKALRACTRTQGVKQSGWDVIRPKWPKNASLLVSPFLFGHSKWLIFVKNSDDGLTGVTGDTSYSHQGFFYDWIQLIGRVN